MQQQSYYELDEKATRFLEIKAGSLEQSLQAKKKVTTILEAMRSEDKILSFRTLTDEEERMLRAFRAFKSDRRICRPGSVFKWQTRPAEPEIGRASCRERV